MLRTRNVVALLERARALCTPSTWYAVGKRTGIKHTTISRCLRRGGTLSDENAIKLAGFLQLDPLTVISYMAEDRAHTEEARDFWTARLPRLLPSFATATVTLMLTAQGALNDGLHEAQLKSAAFDPLYIMRSRIRRLWRVLAAHPAPA